MDGRWAIGGIAERKVLKDGARWVGRPRLSLLTTCGFNHASTYCSDIFTWRGERMSR